MIGLNVPRQWWRFFFVRFFTLDFLACVLGEGVFFFTFLVTVFFLTDFSPTGFFFTTFFFGFTAINR